jgi:dGTPase
MFGLKKMNIREIYENRECAALSRFGVAALNSRGRERDEEQCELRTVFQRDVGRVIHSASFRRLKHKTQVFLSPDGDHYRTRLTHTLEVGQIARSIARALSLNEDLTEAIAMAHDLGHPPFGHAGERTLARLNPDGFEHNAQSLRVVDKIEKNGAGLNLTWEVRDGILHHTGSPAETMEGRIVHISDRIAYINHDIDDALHAGVLEGDMIPAEIRRVLGHSYTRRINTLVTDVVANSFDSPEPRMSEEVGGAMEALRDFLFDAVYTNPVVKGEERKADGMITELYEFYRANPDMLPMQYIETAFRENIDTAVCDYIAGMSDNYAVAVYQDNFIPKGWDKR